MGKMPHFVSGEIPPDLHMPFYARHPDVAAYVVFLPGGTIDPYWVVAWDKAPGPTGLFADPIVLECLRIRQGVATDAYTGSVPAAVWHSLTGFPQALRQLVFDGELHHAAASQRYRDHLEAAFGDLDPYWLLWKRTIGEDRAGPRLHLVDGDDEPDDVADRLGPDAPEWVKQALRPRAPERSDTASRGLDS